MEIDAGRSRGPERDSQGLGQENERFGKITRGTCHNGRPICASLSDGMGLVATVQLLLRRDEGRRRDARDAHVRHPLTKHDIGFMSFERFIDDRIECCDMVPSRCTNREAYLSYSRQSQRYGRATDARRAHDTSRRVLVAP